MSVHTAKRLSQPMAMPTVSIAATSAISLTGLEVVIVTSEELRNEKMYQTTMTIAKNLLKQGVICPEEYGQIDTIMTEKYHPSLGSLLCRIDLIDTP